MRFVALDGEATSDGIYVLLAASDGSDILSMAGLGSHACLEYLCDVAQRAGKGARLVCFGLGYDVNQWLGGVPKHALRELWDTGYAVWRGYQLRWLPRRWFQVQSPDGRRARITEVFGFFQSSFVAALDAWGLGAQPELETMKRRRASFTRAEIERVRAYCHAECCKLVELMGALHAATVEADCVPRNWIGAGALAGAMLAARGLAEHHAHDGEIAPVSAQEVILRAYFGGRIEALRIGSYNAVQSADVRSAYPYAATLLPSLQGARLQYRRGYDAGAEHAIWRVRWAGAAGELMPFPVRNRQAIYYPRHGEGHYHACEVRAAIALGYPVDVLGGWVLREPAGRPAPFAWVPEAYAIRARWKREGNAAEKALKLGLNSLYGKLAQGVGYTGGPPRWQSYFWAGEITARTRARILTLAHAAREPIAIATDGLYAGGVAGRSSAGLGGIERARHDSLFVAQPGLYACENNGVMSVKSRGHFAREVDYGALREGFQQDGFEHVHHYSSRRFVGLGTALMRRDLRLWRTWPDERRAISLYPTRKLPGEGGLMLPPDGRGLDPSEPYTPKGGLQDTAQVDNVQAAEQPLRRET